MDFVGDALLIEMRNYDYLKDGITLMENLTATLQERQNCNSDIAEIYPPPRSGRIWNLALKKKIAESSLPLVILPRNYLSLRLRG